MTIRNLEYYIAGLWDWAILDGCFGKTRIHPTDIDGCIERNGQTLFLEAKRPGKDIPTGQKIMFERWAATGCISVIVVWGEKDLPESMQVFTPFGVKPQAPTDMAGFRAQVANWYEWAAKQKRRAGEVY